MNFLMAIHFLDLLGTVVFAITGLLAASRKQLDLFGAVVLAMVTAVGGGTLRDLILDVPVFWTQQTIYIYVIVISTLIVYVYNRYYDIPMKLLLVLDALGLAVFTVIGAQKAFELGFSDPIVIMFGIMTGVVGGIIRDVLVGEVPLIFRKEIYATASFLGASVLVLGLRFLDSPELAALLAMIVVFGLRMLAIHKNYGLPIFVSKSAPADDTPKT
ncbi:trimeric intracellular cation channel family protein [Thiomicrospira microaerophila]|uniref:trimeric intracellular cation channel family protein n=1 Tax=Thiomicrospira microaerophila TaxID=406020 RepID=UPI0020100F38|nr:trimeric intracellular cation channel family protein [Thiomicrospira microaerophila]UQB41430.1 trimeric intracellular cation channel family protein [Thiomicrospira microaerophila]